MAFYHGSERIEISSMAFSCMEKEEIAAGAEMSG